MRVEQAIELVHSGTRSLIDICDNGDIGVHDAHRVIAGLDRTGDYSRKYLNDLYQEVSDLFYKKLLDKASGVLTDS